MIDILFILFLVLCLIWGFINAFFQTLCFFVLHYLSPEERMSIITMCENKNNLK